MKFLSSDSKLYYLLHWIFIAFVISFVLYVGVVSVLGFTFSVQLVYFFLYNNTVSSKPPLKEFFRQCSVTYVIKAIAVSIISFLVVGLAAFNFYLLEAEQSERRYLWFIYLFLFVFIVYIVLITNLYLRYLLEKQIRFSQIIFASAVNYPKFLFFFSLMSGVSYLLLNSSWSFLTFALYPGASIYIAYTSVARSFALMLEMDKGI